MLSLFKNNSPFTVLILFIFTLLVKLQALLHPVLPVQVPQHFFYNGMLAGLHYVFGKVAFAYTFLALLLTFIQALYVNSITNRHKMFNRFTYIPAFVFLLLGSVYPTFSQFSEPLIINWFLLAALDTMFGFTQTTQPRKLIYNAGFFLCLTALFQFSFLAFFLLLLVAMVLFRPVNLAEWTVAMMGYLTPFYITACLLFLADGLHLLPQWAHIGFSITSHLPTTRYLVISISGIVLLLFAGVYAMQGNVAMSNIYVRRDWTAISFYLILAVVGAFITDDGVKGSWLLVIPPISIVVAHALQMEKNRRFCNFIFYFSLLYLILCLFIPK